MVASALLKSGAFLAIAAAILSASLPARAYRPFDGTDASVAAIGEFELEMGPAHYYATHGSHYLIAPSTILNLGLVRDLELVVDFKNYVGLDSVPGESRVRLLDTDVLLKWVFIRGFLQEERGMSAAVEAGPLTPEIQGQNRFGAQALFIFSHGWKTGAIHFNEEATYNRAGHLDLFSGIILEGSHARSVRPVMEVFVANDFGENAQKYSALVGVIYAAIEGFDLDMGLRVAREHDVAVGEVRLGFTWAFNIWEPSATKVASRPSRRRWM